jgi:hypothetical protein
MRLPVNPDPARKSTAPTAQVTKTASKSDNCGKYELTLPSTGSTGSSRDHRHASGENTLDRQIGKIGSHQHSDALAAWRA